MKKINLISLLFIASLFLIQMSQSSCSNDKLPDPATISNPACDSIQISYDSQIKPIIDNSCAFVGCHNANSPFGDMTDYANMSFYLNDNFFKKRVVDIMDMPEGDMLSPEDFDLVECWVSKGYPEN
jgi:hypothetical protein